MATVSVYCFSVIGINQYRTKAMYKEGLGMGNRTHPNLDGVAITLLCVCVCVSLNIYIYI